MYCFFSTSNPSNLPSLDQAAATAEADTAETNSVASDNMISISEHTDYAPFFKLLKVGVPDPVVRAKLGTYNPFKQNNENIIYVSHITYNHLPYLTTILIF